MVQPLEAGRIGNHQLQLFYDILDEFDLEDESHCLTMMRLIMVLKEFSRVLTEVQQRRLLQRPLTQGLLKQVLLLENVLWLNFGQTESEVLIQCLETYLNSLRRLSSHQGF
jgi:hypothetical protein